MFELTTHISWVLDIFARSGGGGSSGGSGGGEGGIFMVGYVSMHFVSSKLRKHFWDSRFWTATQVVSWALATILLVGLTVWIGVLGFMIGLGGMVGAGTGLYGALEKLRQRKKVKKALALSGVQDPVWNEEAIKTRVSEVFMAYQRDWTNRDWERMRDYMTPQYHQHASLMVAALLQAKRINNVKNPAIEEMVVAEMRDSTVNSQDRVTIGIKASAVDELTDELTGEMFYADIQSFAEYWQFQRVGDTWMLDGIEQSTASVAAADLSLQRLAKENGYFYSLDWGWLLIPRRGSLFSGARFGTSDINNHIIGIYSDTYLLQLYTYQPNPAGKQEIYLIAQTNVPRQYGRIVVRRKKWSNWPGIRGLRKISMEWGDFNKKYEVFSSSTEGVTSFELLHPAYMEKLVALKFDVNIEVVDNVVYLYRSQTVADTSRNQYAAMLELLREAYKQMRM